MKSYTKKYLEHFNFSTSDFIPCEICGERAVDIHHIEARGMGGSKGKDDIENIMAVCRKHHLEYGDKKDKKEFLKIKHLEYMKKFAVLIMIIFASCSYKVTFGEISFLGFTIKDVSILPKSVKNPLVIGKGSTKNAAAKDAYDKLKSFGIKTDTLYVYNAYVDKRFFNSSYTVIGYGIK